MSVLSIRVSDSEKNLLESYASFCGTTISAAVKEIVFEKLEDEYDISLLEEALSTESSRTYSMDEAAQALGIADVV